MNTRTKVDATPRRNKKLKTFRELLYIGLPTLVFLLAMTGLYWWHLIDSGEKLRQETVAQTDLRARQVNDALSEAVSMLFLHVDGALINLIDFYRINQGTRAFDQQAQVLLERFPAGSVMQVAVIDKAGYLKYTNLGSKEKIYLGDREHFTAHLNAQLPKLFVSKPVMGRVSKKWSIQFSRPIIQDGVFQGVMVLSVSPEYLYGTLSNLSQDSSDVILIVRNSGEIMARNKDFENSIGFQSLKNRPFIGAPAGARGKFQTFGAYDHIERVYHWVHLKYYPAVVILGMSVDSLNSPIEQAIEDERFKGVLGTIGLWAISLLAVYTTLRMQSNMRKRVESEYAANHDALTGLDNRKSLLEHFQETHANRESCAVLFIDLDDFKPINDQYGHAAGDTVLTAVAQRIKRCAREMDFVARLGGDEFVVVLDKVRSAQEVQVVVNRIRHSLASPIGLDGTQLSVGASIGVALYPEQGQTPEELLQAADKDMYRVKNTRKQAAAAA